MPPLEGDEEEVAEGKSIKYGHPVHFTKGTR